MNEKIKLQAIKSGAVHFKEHGEDMFLFDRKSLSTLIDSLSSNHDYVGTYLINEGDGFQGKCVNKIDDKYHIQLFSWITGNPTEIIVVDKDYITGSLLYSDEVCFFEGCKKHFKQRMNGTKHE